MCNHLTPHDSRPPFDAIRQPRRHALAYPNTLSMACRFANGALPFTKRETYTPVYREGTWPSDDCKDLCEGLLVQVGAPALPSTRHQLRAHNHLYDLPCLSATACPTPTYHTPTYPQPQPQPTPQPQPHPSAIAPTDPADSNLLDWWLRTGGSGTVAAPLVLRRSNRTSTSPTSTGISSPRARSRHRWWESRVCQRGKRTRRRRPSARRAISPSRTTKTSILSERRSIPTLRGVLR